MKNILLLAVVIISLSGCVAQWKKVTTANRVVVQNGVEIELPLKWVTIKPNKSLQITSLDGPPLNQISIETIKLSDIEKNLKIKLPEDLDKLEASRQFIAYWSNTTGISEFKIISNKYVEQNDDSFFLVEWTFKDENGVTIKNITQGTINGGNLIHISFSAPRQHYFDKSFSVFENVLKTVKINS